MHAQRRGLPRVLTTAGARHLGLTRSAVRHGVDAYGWRVLARGVVLTRDDEPTRDDWASVGLSMSGPGAALSGWDAARIRGLGDRHPPSTTVLVLDRTGRNRRFGDVLIRPTPRPFLVSTLPGDHPTLPHASYVSAPRAVADTALMYSSLAPVRALVTSSVQRNCCTPEQLVLELEACPRGGSRWFRRSLQDLMVNARSIAEAEAVDRLAAARVPAFEVNVPVVDVWGRTVAVLDILWRALRAVAEIDSKGFHFSEADWRATLDRHNRLTRIGLAVGHHAPSEIRNGKRAWAGRVAAWLRARAQELDVPFVPGGGAVTTTTRGPAPLQLSLIESQLWSL